MSCLPDKFAHLARWGVELHDRVLSRDGCHLAPARLTQAAAGRLKAGIVALECWLRRVLLAMALHMEAAGLAANQVPDPRGRRRRALVAPRYSLQMFRNTAPFDRARIDDLEAAERRKREARRRMMGGRKMVDTAPLFARLAALRDLVEAPEPRARRLAFALARRRPGLIWVMVLAGDPRGRRGRRPVCGRVPAHRFGTEINAVYESLEVTILEASRARPPPLGPRPKPGPRIRQL